MCIRDSAESAATDDNAALGKHLLEGLRLVVFFTVPSAIGLVILDRSIISLIYERFAFSPSTTIHTALALRYYAIGLVAFAAIKVLAPLFYALNQAKIPLLASLAAVATNLTISISLHGTYGYKILALATALAALVNSLILYVFVISKLKSRFSLELLIHTVKIALASAIMGALVYALNRWLITLTGFETFATKLICVFVPIILGAMVYGGVTTLLQVREAGALVSLLKRRLKRPTE